MAKTIAITTPNGIVQRSSIACSSGAPLARLKRSGSVLCIVGGISIAVLILIGLGVGLGVGLTRRGSNQAPNSSDVTGSMPADVVISTSTVILKPHKSSQTIPTATYKVRPSQTAAIAWWQPTAGESWQISLIRPPTNTDIAVAVFDLDLFDSSLSFIANLKQKGHRVICYFSAGSYEDWRVDAKDFTNADYGKSLNDWAGEWWLDTNSQNVRNIMLKRIALAQSKGCDAVDPDNINGYQNPTGFNLTENDAISFLKFMANEAHSRGMSIGLKNGGAIVPDVVEFMDFCVQESCVAYNECAPYHTFLEYNSPVFHIEYPDESNMTIAEICSPGNGAQGFSTIIKHLDLDNWTKYCPT